MNAARRSAPETADATPLLEKMEQLRRVRTTPAVRKMMDELDDPMNVDEDTSMRAATSTSFNRRTRTTGPNTKTANRTTWGFHQRQSNTG